MPEETLTVLGGGNNSCNVSWGGEMVTTVVLAILEKTVVLAMKVQLVY